MVFYIVLFILSAFLYISAPEHMSRGFEIVCLLVAFLSIYSHFRIENRLRYNRLSNIYLRHSVFFLICFSIVFFQYHIDYIIGFIGEDAEKIWIDTKYVSKSLALTILVLNSFFIGYRFRQSKEHHEKVKYTLSYTYDVKKYVCYLGYFLIFVYLFTVDKDFLYGGYAKGGEAGEVNVVIVLLQSVIIAAMALYCYDYKNVRMNTSAFVRTFSKPLGLILLYILAILVSGRRGGAVRMVSLLLIVYLFVIYRVNYKRLFLVAIGLGFVFAIIGAIRQMDDGTVSAGMDILTDNYSISPFTKELAGSIQTLHVAVSNFPHYFPYNYGITFFPGFLVLIPGAERLYREVLTSGVPMGSGDVLTNIYFNNDPQWGLGSSLIADSYISFGTLGSIILFAILGIFFRYLEVETFIKRKSVYMLALSFCCYSQFLVICRGSFNGMFLSVSYSFLIVFACHIFSSRKLVAVKN